jgi:N-acetyltransferase
MPFEMQPYLRSELLEMRPLQLLDFEAVYAVASDPLVWEQHPVPDRWKREVFERFFAGTLNTGGGMVVIDRAKEKIIGSTRFDRYDEDKAEVEIGGTFLGRAYWGGVFNREMKEMMLTHAFQFVNRVMFVVGVGNHRSQRAMEKIGGRRIGTRIVPNLGEHYVYEITAGGYELAE